MGSSRAAAGSSWPASREWPPTAGPPAAGPASCCNTEGAAMGGCCASCCACGSCMPLPCSSADTSAPEAASLAIRAASRSCARVMPAPAAAAPAAPVPFAVGRAAEPLLLTQGEGSSPAAAVAAAAGGAAAVAACTLPSAAMLASVLPLGAAGGAGALAVFRLQQQMQPMHQSQSQRRCLASPASGPAPLSSLQLTTAPWRPEPGPQTRAPTAAHCASPAACGRSAWWLRTRPAGVRARSAGRSAAPRRRG